MKSQGIVKEYLAIVSLVGADLTCIFNINFSLEYIFLGLT